MANENIFNDCGNIIYEIFNHTEIYCITERLGSVGGKKRRKTSYSAVVNPSQDDGAAVDSVIKLIKGSNKMRWYARCEPSLQYNVYVKYKYIANVLLNFLAS